jgi:hypothetical protein
MAARDEILVRYTFMFDAGRSLDPHHCGVR